MGRSPCCDKLDLKKGPWTSDEDRKLHGYRNWHALPSKAGLRRCGKSSRLRRTNYLRPDIKRGKFTLQEEETIIQLHALLGNRWSAIASHLPKRTDNEIKNYWNTNIKKRLTKMGIDQSSQDPLLHSASHFTNTGGHVYTNGIINIHEACSGEMQYDQNIINDPTRDPMTHKPKNHVLDCGRPKDFVNLCHMAQWESVRLQAEARLVRESKLEYSNNCHLLKKTTSSTAAPRSRCLDVLKVWKLANLGKNQNISATKHNLVQSPIFGLLSENDPSINYVRMHGACTPEPPNHIYQDDVMQGRTENLVGLHDNMLMDPVNATYDADSFGFSSLLEGFADLSGNNGVTDHNVLVNDVNNWDNYTLNAITSSLIAVSEGKLS